MAGREAVAASEPRSALRYVDLAQMETRGVEPLCSVAKRSASTGIAGV